MIKAPTSNFLILAYYSFNFPHIKILINCCSHSLHHNDVSTPVIRALSQRESWAQMIWTLWSLTPTGASTSWTVSWRSSGWGSSSTLRWLWSSRSWRIRKRWREPWFLPWSTAERTWDSSRRRKCVIHSLDLFFFRPCICTFMQTYEWLSYSLCMPSFYSDYELCLGGIII